MAERTLNLAVFVDYDNVAIGARDARYGGFDMHLVLERLLEKGQIIVKKAYADWSRYESAKKPMHESAFELVEIPQTSYSGKNSADIRLVVDALDLCYTKTHVDVVAVVSGDSDFSPLVSKLRENGKTVIGVGVKNSTSRLLVENCDEFIYYDDLERVASKRKPIRKKAEKKPANSGEDAKKTTDDKEDKEDKDVESNREEVVESLVEIIRSLGRDYDPLWGSLVKQTMRRVHPGFNESYYGFKSFSDMLKNVADMGLIELEHDQERGNFKIVLKDD